MYIYKNLNGHLQPPAQTAKRKRTYRRNKQKSHLEDGFLASQQSSDHPPPKLHDHVAPTQLRNTAKTRQAIKPSYKPISWATRNRLMSCGSPSTSREKEKNHPQDCRPRRRKRPKPSFRLADCEVAWNLFPAGQIYPAVWPREYVNVAWHIWINRLTSLQPGMFVSLVIKFQVELMRQLSSLISVPDPGTEVAYIISGWFDCCVRLWSISNLL